MPPRCPTCRTRHRVMPADEAIDYLREKGQLDEWTAAALGHEEALAWVRREHGLMKGDSYPRDYHCENCFTSFNVGQRRI